MKEIFKAIDDAYFLLDKCIDKLLKGRITKNEKLEQEAYCDMEYAVNGTMQNLSYLAGRLKGKTLNDWIKVEDRLPKIGKRVMVCQSFNDGSTFARMATRVKINQIDRWYNDDGFEEEYITHWMPIVPPKED